ncbi:MAG TPA: radical SAM protein, partial [Candidatus Deferrimicrobiaceae bacterium]
RGLEILSEIRKFGITCDWVELRVDYITEPFLSELAGLGVRTIFMGWESGNAGTLKRIAKGFSPGTILEKTRILAKFSSLTVDASAIVGFPWESEKEIADTVSLMLEMFRVNPFRLNFNIGLYVPYPGAPVTAEAESRGFAFPGDHRGWSDYDILAGTLELPWLTRRQVERYRLVDRYAKMLFVPPTLAAPLRIACRALAAVAFLRIRYGVFALPFEIRLQSAAIRFMLRARSRRT